MLLAKMVVTNCFYCKLKYDFFFYFTPECLFNKIINLDFRLFLFMFLIHIRALRLNLRFKISENNIRSSINLPNEK